MFYALLTGADDILLGTRTTAPRQSSVVLAAGFDRLEVGRLSMADYLS